MRACAAYMHASLLFCVFHTIMFDYFTHYADLGPTCTASLSFYAVLKQHPLPPSDCADILRDGNTTSGEYRIFLPRTRKYASVYCDMESDGGGWLVGARVEATIISRCA